MEINKELITPALASVYLKSNIANRRLKQPVVIRYAQDISAGRWKEDTAELIKISKSGKVLDGQHRLHAVIKANKPAWFHVAKNVPEEVFDVLDTGSTRNASDVFKIDGIKNDNSIPSIIQMYNLLNLGRGDSSQKNDRSTNAMLLSQYNENDDFWQYIAYKTGGWYNAFAKVLPPSYIGGFYAFLSDVSQDKAEEFMEQLTKGVGIVNDTVALLRIKLIQDKMSSRKMSKSIKMALTIKAWNCFITGKITKVLKYDSTREEFPKAIKKPSVITI